MMEGNPELWELLLRSVASRQTCGPCYQHGLLSIYHLARCLAGENGALRLLEDLRNALAYVAPAKLFDVVSDTIELVTKDQTVTKLSEVNQWGMTPATFAAICKALGEDAMRR